MRDENTMRYTPAVDPVVMVEVTVVNPVRVWLETSGYVVWVSVYPNALDK